MRKRIIYVIIIVVLLLTGCTIGGSFYMLNFSLYVQKLSIPPPMGG